MAVFQAITAASVEQLPRSFPSHFSGQQWTAQSMRIATDSSVDATRSLLWHKPSENRSNHYGRDDGGDDT